MKMWLTSMIMLTAIGVNAADVAPGGTTHIRVGASISRSLSLSSAPLMRFQESRPGSPTLQARADLNLGAASAGCTVHIPSSIVLESASVGAPQSIPVKLLQVPSARFLEAQMEVPHGMPAGAYEGVMDVVVVFN